MHMGVSVERLCVGLGRDERPKETGERKDQHCI